MYICIYKYELKVYFYIHWLNCVHVFMYIGKLQSYCMCRSQGTTFRKWFSPSTTSVLRLNFGHQELGVPLQTERPNSHKWLFCLEAHCIFLPLRNLGFSKNGFYIMNGITKASSFDITLKVIWHWEVSKSMLPGYDGTGYILGLKWIY